MVDQTIARNRITELRHLPITLTLCGFEAAMLGWGFFEPVWWRNYLHEHSFFEVCYAWQGRGCFRINHQEYPVEEGMVFVAKPGEVHEIISSDNDPLGIYFWSYTLVPQGDKQGDQGANQLLRAFLAADTCVAAMPVLQTTLDLLTAEIVSREAGYLDVVKALVTKMLVDTARAVTEVGQIAHAAIAPKHDSTSLLVYDMVRYLEDNYARPLTIRDVAAQVHLSNRHTNRLFRQVMGQSINSYLTQFRLRIASQLLLRQRFSVTEIAYACGYRDARYFITLFRQHTGVTPAVFRNQGGTRFVDRS